MIESLTKEQEAAMPRYVEKWINIGLDTNETDFNASKECISRIYASQELDVPSYWFYFCDPLSSAMAIFMVDALSDFSDKCTDTTVYGDTTKWIGVFEDLYTQYSNQFDKIVWSDDVKARMLSVVSKAFTGNDVSQKLNSHISNMIFGAHGAGWLSFYDFFHKELNLSCVDPLIPYFDLARVCGWWSAFSEAVFIQDKPSKICQNDRSQLHNLNGPAIEYRNGYKVWCIENIVVPEYVVMDPNQITVKEIDEEINAEKRRVLLQQYGYERYFDNADCTLIDADEVSVVVGEDRKMPRMLVKTKNNDVYFIGTDGSTSRKYFMNIYNSENKSRIEHRFGVIDTCSKAHSLISGLDESKCIAQS